MPLVSRAALALVFLTACGGATSLLAACGGATTVRAPRPGSLNARNAPNASGDPLTCEGLRPSDDARVCVIARFDAEAGVAHVRLSLEAAALPVGRADVALRFREQYFGPRYVEENVRVVDGSPWPDSVGSLDGDGYEIAYEVSLEVAQFEGTSWRRANGWRLTGKSFLPDIYVDGEPFDVPATLVIDPGDSPLMTSVGPEVRVFDAPSLIRLADEGFELGALNVTRREVGETVLWVGTSIDLPDAQLEASADALALAMIEIEERLGPAPTDSVLISFHYVVGGPDDWGERLGSTLVNLGPRLAVDHHSRASARAIHELVHLWNPGSHHIEEQWIDEGLTEFVTVDVIGELTAAEPVAAARTWMRAYDRYAAGAEGRTIRDPGPGVGAPDPGWHSDAGMVAGFCLDAHLQESGSSLHAVLRGVLGDPEPQLGTGVLMQDLARVSGSAASYLEALVVSVGPFAFDDCLERVGFRREETEFAGWDARTTAVEILRAPSIRTLSKSTGFVVEEVSDGSPLAVGDIVRRVHGAPTATLLDVAWALRDVSAEGSFEIELRRDGESATVEATLPVLDDVERAQQAYVELRAIDSGSPDAP